MTAAGPNDSENHHTEGVTSMTSTTTSIEPTGYTFTFYNGGDIRWHSHHASGGVDDSELRPLNQADAEAIIGALRRQFPADQGDPWECTTEMADSRDITPRAPEYSGPGITLTWVPGGWAIATADAPGGPWVLVPMTDAEHVCGLNQPCWCGRS